MRTVKLHWKSRVTKKQKRAILTWIRRHYLEASDCGEYLKLKAANRDTKFIWIFMLANAFKDLE